MNEIGPKAGMWRTLFRAFKENSLPNRSALEESIKFLEQSMDHLSSTNQPIPQSIKDKKANLEKQLANLA
jgi:hypothetical protein